MTSREQQIEELQNLLINKGIFNNLVCKQDYAYPDALINDLCLETAEVVIDNNYRKMDEVTLKLDLGDRSPEEIKQIAEMFNGETKKQVAREIIEELFSIMDAKCDDINADELHYLAKKYGAEIK